MAITNYGELKSAVVGRARRTDLTSLVPDFIRSAHDVITATVAVTTTVSADAATEALPSDFREVVAVMAETFPARPLEIVHAGQVTAGGSGAPRFYRVSGSDLYLYPTPDQAYPVRLLYKLARAMFSADSDTNTVLARYPFLYLYGAMAEVFAHTRDLEQEAKYRQLFASGLDEAERVEIDSFYGNLTLQPSVTGVV